MKTRLSLFLVALVLSTGSTPLPAAEEKVAPPTVGKPKTPIEIGDVRWSRDLDGACAESKKSGRPVMVLFQEVPGCGGCQRFGREVLRHPLIVEAAEDLFHPVVVYNNQKGPDRDLLKRFKEPAWNYQVIRFLDSGAEDLISRKDKVWTLGGVAARMAEALEAAERPVPKYLTTLAQPPEEMAVAVFVMFCYWSGEVKLGGIEGVVATEVGFVGHAEVVRVTYRTDVVTFENLVKKALEVECAKRVYVADEEQAAAAKAAGAKSVEVLDPERYRAAKPEDQQRHIARYPIAKLPGLSPMQRTKINALYKADREAALEWLSPRQKALLEKVK